MALLNSKTGNPVDPSTPMSLMDLSGKIITVPAHQAEGILQDPASGYQLASPSQKNDYASQQKHASEGLMTAGEGLADAATFSMAHPIIKGVISAVDKDLGNSYEQNYQERKEWNPGMALAGQVAGYVADPLGVMGVLGKGASAVAKPLIGEASSMALGRIAQKTIVGGIEGTGFGALNYTLPKLVDDQPFSGDALLDNMSKDALNFSIFHGVLHSGAEALKSVAESKVTAKKLLDKTVNKYTNPEDPTGPSGGPSGGPPGISTQPITFDELNRLRSPLGPKATTFKVKTEPAPIDPSQPLVNNDKVTYTHQDGNKSTVMGPQNISGNGADFSTPQGLQDIGLKNNISDFDVKHRSLKGADQSEKDFLIESKNRQTKINWLNKNEMILTPDEQNVLAQHDNIINALKSHPDEALLKQHLQVINQGIDTITEGLHNKSTIDRGALNDNLVKQELEQMSHEVKNATRTQGLTVDSNGEINGRYDDNSYPDYYREVGAKNPEDFEKILRSGKGKRYDRIVELAKGRLENGYESTTSGPVYPHPDYFTGTAEEGAASRAPISEQNILKGKLGNNPKAVDQFIEGLDHARMGDELHVFKSDKVSGEFTQVKSNPLYSDTANEVTRDLNVSDKIRFRQRIATYNNVADYIKNDLYPKTADEIAGNQHAIDYIAQKNKANLAQFGDKLDNVVTLAINQLEASGKGTQLTHADIADFIENNIMDKYRDPKTGNAKVNFEGQFKQLQDYADSYRSNGFDYTGKYNAKKYHPIEMGELRQMRIDIDKKAKWENPEAGIVPEAARELRDHIEKHIIETLGKNSPELKKAYEAAKHNVHMALQADAIIGQATVRGIERATKGDKNVLGSIIGGKIGYSIGGPIGGAIGYHLGGSIGVGSEAVGMLNGYNSAIRNHMTKVMGEALDKYDAHMTRAVGGVLSNRPSSYQDNKGSKPRSYEALKKDLKALGAAKQSLPDNLNSLMDRNSGLYTMAPNTMNSMMMTASKANEFLLSKAPVNPYQGIPWREDKWEPSQMEIAKFFRYKEAVEKPSTILNQLQNGYVTPEATEVLKQVYPQTLSTLEGKVMSQLNPKKDLSQEKRIMLFKVFGIPMDKYSSGRLFGEMQNTAANMIVAEDREAQGGEINPSKIGDPMKNLTTGTNTLREQD